MTGLQEWAFLLIFLAVWALISVSWSNVEFTEESGHILADIVDQNFERMSERIKLLEQELEELRSVSINLGQSSQDGTKEKSVEY